MEAGSGLIDVDRCGSSSLARPRGKVPSSNLALSALSALKNMSNGEASRIFWSLARRAAAMVGELSPALLDELDDDSTSF